MSLARRVAAALAVTGVGVLAFAVPVAASSDADHDNPPADCVDGAVRANLDFSVDTDAGSAWVKGKAVLCEPVEILLSIYDVPDTWDGRNFNETAVPQTLFDHDSGTLEGTEELRLDVDVPECGNTQIDLYYPPKIEVVDGHGHGRQLIVGHIWQVTPPEHCAPPTKTTPPPTETTTPPPTETTTPPPTETTTPPTSQPAGPIITVTPPPAAAPVPPPQEDLAQTGSSSTLPLIGLGTLLLAAGIVLSLVGRRQPA